MSVIVTDSGFGPETWDLGYVPVSEAANDVAALDVASDMDPAVLIENLGSVQMVRIDFPSFADGRGFTIARTLRLSGYKGRLRAKGHIISDQYAMARRCGFDEVEISDELATRQPAAEWKFRANWEANDYQSRMRG